MFKKLLNLFASKPSSSFTEIFDHEYYSYETAVANISYLFGDRNEAAVGFIKEFKRDGITMFGFNQAWFVDPMSRFA